MSLPPPPAGAVPVDSLPPPPEGAVPYTPPEHEVIHMGEPYKPSMGEKALNVAESGILGLATPMAGALQYFGINTPAKKLNEAKEALQYLGAGTPGTVADIAGQIANPIPLGKAKAVGTLGGMALQGAKAAALTPTEGTEEGYGDFLKNKAIQTAEGAGAGAVLGKAGQAILNPIVSASVQKLKDLGMTRFTPGQLLSDVPFIGEGIQKAEKAMTSLPVAGSMIQNAFRGVNEDFNRAMVNRVLAPMGQQLGKGVKAGEDMMKVMNDAIANAYDTITPKLSLGNMVYKDATNPSGFTSTVKVLNDKLADVTQGLPSAPGYDLAGMVKKEFDKHILDPLTNMAQGKSMTGEEFRNAEKNLGATAYNYLKNPQTYDVGVALRDLQGELRKELAIQNPKLAEELKGIHLAFRRHLPIEQAASMLGAEGRVFTPGQLESGIKAKGGKNAFLQGQAPLYDESQAALDVLGRNLPSSGTAERTGVMSLLGLGGAGLAGIPGALHAVAVPTLTAGAIYNKPVLGALTKLATERPDWMKALQPRASAELSRAAGLQAAQPNP